MAEEEQETGFSTAQIKAITDTVRSVLSETHAASRSATGSEAGSISNDSTNTSSGSQQGEAECRESDKRPGASMIHVQEKN